MMVQRHSSPRQHALDGLRGLLALIVVAHHALQIGGNWVLYDVGLACVAVFFMLSGYVLTRAYDGRYLRFLARRLVRLWPVYAVCLIMGYAEVRAFPSLGTLFWIPSGSVWQVGNPPSWSLCIEARAMLFMPLIAAVGRASWIVCLGACGLCLPAMLLSPDFLWGIPFLLGAGLSRATMRSRWLESAGVQWLGKVSYSLYLSHWLVLHGGFLLFGTPGLLVGLWLVLPTAWVVWYWVERPSILWSRRVDDAAPPIVRFKAN